MGMHLQADEYLHDLGYGDSTPPMTISMWVRRISTDSAGRYIAFQDENDDDAIGLGEGTSPSSFRSELAVGGTPEGISTAEVFNNIWYHVVTQWVPASTDLHVFVDGTKSSNTSVSGSDFTSDRLYIGARRSSSTIFTIDECIIAEIAVWSTILSDANVVLLSNGLTSLLIEPLNTLMYLPLRFGPEVLMGTAPPSLTVVGNPSFTEEHPPIYPIPHPRVMPYSEFMPAAVVDGNLSFGGGVMTI